MRCRWCRCEGQAWGMRGAVPPAAWVFAILLGSDMLFLRPFSGEFAPFAFSQCVGVWVGGLQNTPHGVVSCQLHEKASTTWHVYRAGLMKARTVGEQRERTV